MLRVGVPWRPWIIASAAVMSLGTACLAQSTQAFPQHTVRWLDLEGKLHVLGESPSVRAIAFVFLSTECPIARKYAPELNRIYRTVANDARVEFYGVLSDASITRKKGAEFAREYGVEFPVLFDASGELADVFQPTHVPEAFVLNGERKLVYRGRIDDVYREIGRRQLAATTHDLRDALAATVDGRPVATPRTTPVGCLFEHPPLQKRLAAATFHRDVAPILYANCVECHRAGEVAPFPLTAYDEAAKRAHWLTEVVKKRQMPPWNAALGHGRFLDERVLTETQIALIDAWRENGAVEGKLDDAPPTPQFPDGWRLGPPDMLVQVPHETVVPPDGPDVFQHYVIRFDADEDKTLIGFDFRPGNPAVVHHAVLLYDSFGAARAKDAKTPEPGYRTFGSVGVPVTGVVGMWIPGMTPRFLPDGIGMHLPKGTDLVLQLHLHPSGREETDQSQFALYFADRPRSKTISKVPLVLGTLMLDVPAGESRHPVRSSVELSAPVTLLSTLPHMHFIGREMRVTATLPGGAVRDLIWIRNWNFYWQDNYVYREPVTLPAGTKIEIAGAFDNSEANPHNPSRPPKRVLFGNGSEDEMFFAVFQTVGESPSAEKEIERALLKQFQEEWLRPTVQPDARPHIIAQAIEFFGGGEVFLKMLLGGSPTSGGRGG